MKKIVIMLLLLMSTNVLAEWTEVSSNSSVGATAYADFQSIRKNGNIAKMWTLMDFKTDQPYSPGIRNLSQVSRYEFICSEEVIRMSDYSQYSKNMGNGENVNSKSGIQHGFWSVAPGTIEEVFFKLACGQK